MLFCISSYKTYLHGYFPGTHLISNVFRDLLGSQCTCSYMSQTRWYTSWYLWPTLPSCQLRKATQWFSYHGIRGQMKSKATAAMKCSTSHCGRWCPCTQEPNNFLVLRLYTRHLNGGHNKKLHSCNTCTKDQFHFSISPCRLGAKMDTMSIGLMGFCWGNWVLNKMHGDWRHQADRPVHIHSTITITITNLPGACHAWKYVQQPSSLPWQHHIWSIMPLTRSIAFELE